MLSISKAKKKSWYNTIVSAENFDIVWYKKMRRKDRRQRQSLYSTLMSDGTFPADTWKMIALIDIAHTNHENAYSVSADYSRFCLQKSYNVRRALFEYSIADSNLIQNWFKRHIKAAPDISTIYQLVGMGMRPIHCDDLQTLIKGNQDEIIEYLDFKNLIPLQTKRETARIFQSKNMGTCLKRLDPYLPEDERMDKGGIIKAETKAPKQVNISKDNHNITWEKIDDGTISRTQDLPNGISVQDIFNFRSEDVRHILFSKTHAFSPSQTIRNFNDIATIEELELVAAKLINLGGSPARHKAAKKPAIKPPKPNA